MKAVAIIPARLESTRLTRKALREIAGKPMIAWVYEAARASSLLEDVIVATDAEEILEFCKKRGFHARLTSPEHRSGTDRVHEVACALAADVFVNVQGDEPLARPEHIEALLGCFRDASVQVSTVMTAAKPDDVNNPNAVKVVTDLAGDALYFSRATIPFDRDGSGPRYFKHLGFYAYQKAALDKFCSLPESALERSERLEQLRFLDNGIPIRVVETPFDTIGVDTEEDRARVEEILRKR